MKSIAKVLTSCILLSLSIGCSDKLTDGKAEDLIRQRLKFPLFEQISISHGLVGYLSDSLPEFYYILQEKGMFTIQPVGQGGIFETSYGFRVTLTAKGKKYIVKDVKDPIKQGETGEFMYNTYFKTCELDFNKIEGVQEIPGLNSAIISYTMQRKNFTPFWSYYEDKDKVKKKPNNLQPATFGAVKMNDGWRPEND